MSEAERIAEKTYPPNEARAYLDGYNAALRAQEQNEPQCKDCKHLGKAWACENCTHDRELRNRTSYYEPKGADRESEAIGRN